MQKTDSAEETLAYPECMGNPVRLHETQYGSTALAAMMTGRQYLGAEIDRNYYEIARKRIEWAKMVAEEEIPGDYN